MGSLYLAELVYQILLRWFRPTSLSRGMYRLVELGVMGSLKTSVELAEVLLSEQLAA